MNIKQLSKMDIANYQNDIFDFSKRLTNEEIVLIDRENLNEKQTQTLKTILPYLKSYLPIFADNLMETHQGFPLFWDINGEGFLELLKKNRYDFNDITLLYYYIVQIIVERYNWQALLSQDEISFLEQTVFRNAPASELTKISQDWDYNCRVKIPISTRQFYFENDRKEFQHRYSKVHGWIDEIHNLKDFVKKNILRLEELRKGLSFVELAMGFVNLREQKEKEEKPVKIKVEKLENWIYYILIIKFVMSFLLLILTNIDLLPNTFSTYSILLPLFGFLFILIYNYRISLHNLRAVQAELIQIDLRISLLTFIESYIDYINKNDKDASRKIEKFESVIFSSITPKAENIPGTLDGIESIASLIRSLQGLKPKTPTENN